MAEKKGFKFNLGDKVRDRFTDFEGVVTLQADFLTGCNIYAVDEKSPHGIAKENIDETRLVMVQEKWVAVEPSEPFKFENGDRVRDTVTSYEGTITTRLMQVSGVNRYGVERVTLNGGNTSDTLDEHRLVKLEAPKAEVPAAQGRRTGGGPINRGPDLHRM